MLVFNANVFSKQVHFCTFVYSVYPRWIGCGFWNMRCKDRKKEEIHLRRLNKQITKKEYHNDRNRLIFYTKDIGFWKCYRSMRKQLYLYTYFFLYFYVYHRKWKIVWEFQRKKIWIKQVRTNVMLDARNI